MKRMPYDDPYQLLAAKIATRYSIPEINRLLSSPQIISQIVMNELREIDMQGAFIDCIITDLCDKGKRMEFVGIQKQFASELAQKLDHPRLCADIREWCDRLERQLG